MSDIFKLLDLPELPEVRLPTLPSLTAADVAAVFGEGSELHAVAKALENPRPFVCHECGCAVSPAMNRWCEDCRARAYRFEALHIAFGTVARCIDLVETFGEGLFEARHDGQYASELDAASHAYRALGRLARSRPDLLPFDTEDA